MSLLTDPTAATHWMRACEAARPIRLGTVRRVLGNGFEVAGLDAAIGDLVMVETDKGPLSGLVVALHDDSVVVSAYGELDGLRCGQLASAPGGPPRLAVGPELLGRVVDALGTPIDDGPAFGAMELVELDERAPHPLRRQRITQPMAVGVRAIDAAITCGRGQRIGIFAGSGVGKSTLLSMMVREATADVVVIGLVGERGREVREFLENDLGPEGLAKSVVVVATGDEPALMRLTAAQSATRIAESFRDAGKDVLLLVDSITRFAMAQREIGLAAGEFPASRGYPPSVLSALPRLLERAGAGPRGSITAFYTVLVEGDDMNDPVADAVRGILDGHIVLTRALAQRGHFPSIDVLASVSRVMNAVTTADQQGLARQLREQLASYEESRDLIEVGAYVPGSNSRTDLAIARREHVLAFLQQDSHEPVPFDRVWSELRAAVGITPQGVAS
ncbi:MAG: FliI/YscN family ATPase [Acidimicrobiales bacterium]